MVDPFASREYRYDTMKKETGGGLKKKSSTRITWPQLTSLGGADNNAIYMREAMAWKYRINVCACFAYLMIVCKKSLLKEYMCKNVVLKL